jgi:MFS superfamily sulfate permease-like transporter
MKRVMVLLVMGTLLSGIAAYAATARTSANDAIAAKTR